jgi:hypothetical protein
MLSLLLLLPSVALAAAEVAESTPSDDASPAVFFAFLFIFAVALVLIGVGIVIGLVICGIAAVLLALGVVSSSVAAGLLTRRSVTAVRVFLLQCGLLAGVPVGILCAWLAHYVLAAVGPGWLISFYGAVGGAVAGVVVALLLDFTFRRARAWTMTKVISKTPREIAAQVT